MSQLDPMDLFLGIAGALALQSLILFVVINMATKADKRAKYDRAQTQFLAFLAKEKGMSEQEVNEIMDKL